MWQDNWWQCFKMHRFSYIIRMSQVDLSHRLHSRRWKSVNYFSFQLCNHTSDWTRRLKDFPRTGRVEGHSCGRQQWVRGGGTSSEVEGWLVLCSKVCLRRDSAQSVLRVTTAFWPSLARTHAQDALIAGDPSYHKSTAPCCLRLCRAILVIDIVLSPPWQHNLSPVTDYHEFCVPLFTCLI